MFPMFSTMLTYYWDNCFFFKAMHRKLSQSHDRYFPFSTRAKAIVFYFSVEEGGYFNYVEK